MEADGNKEARGVKEGPGSTRHEASVSWPLQLTVVPDEASVGRLVEKVPEAWHPEGRQPVGDDPEAFPGPVGPGMRRVPEVRQRLWRDAG